MVIALLAGGTGGAKLACGFRDLAAERGGRLDVIANTGDDIEIYGAYVSPDPDLITYRLAGRIGERGFGVFGETNHEMMRRRDSREDVWFELGDEDLAVCTERARLLAAGADPTDAHSQATAMFDTHGVHVLPMSHEPVRTSVATRNGTFGLQEFLIRERCAPEIDAVIFEGADEAPPSPHVLRALDEAELIVIGPSNPVISIGPILALDGMFGAIRGTGAPVVAVSPFVGGEVVKGPTDAFMSAAGVSAGPAGLAEIYDGWIDGIVADQPVAEIETRVTDVMMENDASALRLAREVAEFGRSLVKR